MKDKEVQFGTLVDDEWLWFSQSSELVAEDIYPEDDEYFDFYLKRILKSKSYNLNVQSGYLHTLPKNAKLAASFDDMIAVYSAYEEMDFEVLNKQGFVPDAEDINSLFD